MLLEVKDLHVSFHTYAGEVKAVRGLSYTLNKGEVLAVVGESGCGKSVSVQTVLRLIPIPPGEIKKGEILLNGRDVLKLSEKEMQKVRGNEVSMIFQDPMTSLNPTMTIGRQIAEVLTRHQGMRRVAAMEKAIEILTLVEVPNARERAHQYPHEFSGGMRQRVMIAMALACSPDLLIADEPSTALDVTIQAQMLDLLKGLQKKLQTSIILITHDLGVVANIAQQVMIMYAGLAVETGDLREVFYDARHPYTWGLMKSMSRLDLNRKRRLTPIEGVPPDLLNPPEGCPFADRCDYAMRVCREEMPELKIVSGNHGCACWLLHEEAPKVSRPELNGG
ncbi:MAG TPA: peptide ABC transporter ATP-binding protein [Clostridiales bacterium]|nr:peptide ABC transporter ATP-binding protein [Clostridiales bacterium]